jgi:endonuclease G
MRHGPAFLKCFAALLVLPMEAWGFVPSVSPSPIPQEVRLKKLALEISYAPTHKQANWVFYPLGPDQLQNCVGRGNRFRPDPELRDSESAQLSDYSGSGFDRGHLSPAADNKWSAQAMEESFLLSNISPQPPRFNQGIWARLENSVRAWAAKFQGIYVATGPFLEPGLRKVGDGLSVPQYYFKALITQESAKRKSGIAFLLPTNAEGKFGAYAVPIDYVEQFTGIDFFAGTPEEERVEGEKDLSLWNPDLSYRTIPCTKTPFEFFQLPYSSAE